MSEQKQQGKPSTVIASIRYRGAPIEVVYNEEADRFMLDIGASIFIDGKEMERFIGNVMLLTDLARKKPGELLSSEDV